MPKLRVAVLNDVETLALPLGLSLKLRQFLETEMVVAIIGDN